MSGFRGPLVRRPPIGELDDRRKNHGPVRPSLWCHQRVSAIAASVYPTMRPCPRFRKCPCFRCSLIAQRLCCLSHGIITLTMQTARWLQQQAEGARILADPEEPARSSNGRVQPIAVFCQGRKG